LQKESKFSPFSPDPNLYEKNETLPHSSGTYSTFGSSPLHTHGSKVVGGPNGNNEKISPTSLRPPVVSQRFGSYFNESRRQEAPISRPKSGTPPNGSSHTAQQNGKEHEVMSDFNGTLASLDLDSQTMWKSSSGDNYAANVYAQYKAATSNGGTPSP